MEDTTDNFIIKLGADSCDGDSNNGTRTEDME